MKIIKFMRANIAIMIISGCGITTDSTIDEELSKESPHKFQIQKIREVESPDNPDYLNYMKSYDISSSNFYILSSWERRLFIKKDRGFHYSFYIDVDSNNQTGYYNPWLKSAGAEYLWEDDTLFIYRGEDGTNEWSWEPIAYNTGDKIDYKIVKRLDLPSLKDALVYAVSFDRDWVFQRFLGYSYRGSADRLEHLYYYSGYFNNIKISANDENIYIKKYINHTQNSNIDLTRDKRAYYYNYTLKSGDTIYYTEGNSLFDSKWNLITDNLPYLVDDQQSVTVIPKKYIDSKDIEFISLVIRSVNWDPIREFKITDGYNRSLSEYSIINKVDSISNYKIPKPKNSNSSDNWSQVGKITIWNNKAYSLGALGKIDEDYSSYLTIINLKGNTPKLVNQTLLSNKVKAGELILIESSFIYIVTVNTDDMLEILVVDISNSFKPIKVTSISRYEYGTFKRAYTTANNQKLIYEGSKGHIDIDISNPKKPKIIKGTYEYLY